MTSSWRRSDDNPNTSEERYGSMELGIVLSGFTRCGFPHPSGSEAKTMPRRSEGAGLEDVRYLELELSVVDAGQEDTFPEHLLPDVFGGIDGGEDAVDLLLP